MRPAKVSRVHGSWSLERAKKGQSGPDRAEGSRRGPRETNMSLGKSELVTVSFPMNLPEYLRARVRQCLATPPCMSSHTGTRRVFNVLLAIRQD